MDVYNRSIPGWSLSNTMEAEWVLNTLVVTVNKFGKPEIINTDQGSQFTSYEYFRYKKCPETVRISHESPPGPLFSASPLNLDKNIVQ